MGREENFHIWEIRMPVPPPRPAERGVCVNSAFKDRAAGVVVLSGWIQVSVRARTWMSERCSRELMNSVLLTAD